MFLARDHSLCSVNRCQLDGKILHTKSVVKRSVKSCEKMVGIFKKRGKEKPSQAHLDRHEKHAVVLHRRAGLFAQLVVPLRRVVAPRARPLLLAPRITQLDELSRGGASAQTAAQVRLVAHLRAVGQFDDVENAVGVLHQQAFATLFDAAVAARRAEQVAGFVHLFDLRKIRLLHRGV